MTRKSDRSELVQAFKEIAIEAGVYEIRHIATGKRFVDSTRNFKTLNGTRFSLGMGSHVNKALQADWSRYGEAAFAIEVLEVLEKPKDNAFFDEKDALRKLEEKWLERLQPYGERGYN